jgi:DNA repair protein RadA/Sms
LVEAARLGFDHAIVPPGEHGTPPAGMRVSVAEDLTAAMRALGDESGVVVSMLRGRPG